jgi:predicted MFS family arabinose efflux permease
MRGYAGWRWIFIIEGGLTVFISFFFYFLLPDFPEDVKWLADDEKAYVTARLRADQGSAAHERKITLRDVATTLSDHRVLIGGFMYFGLIVPAYSYAYFAPGIIHGYGYDAIRTQLFSVPPWAVAFVFSMIVATVSDKARHRFSFAITCICISIAALTVLVTVTDNTKLQYGMLFLVTSGTYTAMPIIVCWFNMNLGGHHRRSIGSAWQVGFGNTGGIIATFAFQGGRNHTGYIICLSFAALSFVSCVMYLLACHRANTIKNRDAGRTEALTEEQKADMGDLSPDYRYLL